MYPLYKKLIGYKNRIRYEWYLHCSRKKLRLEDAAYQKWKRRFLETRNELIIGSNFDLAGGVRNHIHSIKRFSTFRSEIIPPDLLLKKYGPALFLRNKPDFIHTKPSPFVKICHSHVSPWFIDWCFTHKDSFLWVHTHHAWYHDDTTPEGPEPWQKELNEAGLFALRNCHRPIVVSRWQQHFLKENYAIEAEYIPNGVNTEICKQGDADRFRRTHRINKPFILWLGRNEPVKNPLEILIVASKLPQIEFVMAGNTCRKAGFEKLLGHMLPSNIHAIGELNRIAAQDAIAACAALVVTSKREGLPTLILEAMIHKKPIVTSDAEGCLDATDGGKFGLVYQRGNTSHLTEQLLKVVFEPKKNEDGHRFAIREFSWENVIKKLDKSYSMKIN